MKYQQPFEAMAQARDAAQAALEKIVAGDLHPNLLIDHVREVERWCYHAREGLNAAIPAYNAQQEREERDQFYHDVFVTALEGGIGYWSQSESYRWSVGDSNTPDLTGFEARVIDLIALVEDAGEGDDALGTAPVLTVNREVIERGLKALAEGTATWGGRKLSSKAQAFYAGILATLDGGDVDANAADNIVQAGLFGDVRYG